MKLVVFGSTGGIGRKVVEQALSAGHDVTAVARRPSAITIQHPRLEVVRSDVLEPATLGQSIEGKDAVISAIGATDKGPTTVYSQGVENISQAMRTAHVRRLICVSASGLDLGNPIQRLFAGPLLWLFLKNSYTDLVRMENVVTNSSLDWTIMRPPRLTDGPLTRHYQVALGKHLAGNWMISRADLADAILALVNNPASFCVIAETAY